jgi:hypothetical protein
MLLPRSKRKEIGPSLADQCVAPEVKTQANLSIDHST